MSALKSDGLIGLKGLIDGKHFVFMLDSGASGNFISHDLFRTLGIGL